MKRLAQAQLRTTWGTIRLHAADGRLLRCDLPMLSTRPPGDPKVLGQRMEAGTSADRRVLAAGLRFVRGLLQGRQGARPALQYRTEAPFLDAAWDALQKIPAGATCTYAELAILAGRPRAARAAGQACARNPLPLFVPCHRVLASGGALGGFSSGLAWKTYLLARERGRRSAR
jgi:O-6-methylguanine DNA methyltransferase